MGKYLKLYNKFILEKEMSMPGLCEIVGGNNPLLKILTPTTVEEFPYYGNTSSIKYAYWAFDGETSGWKGEYVFSPLRQNILLFMAAMNNEL